MGRMLLSEYITDGIAKREMYQVIEQFVDAMLETESSNQRVVLRLEEYEINNGKVVMKYERAERPLNILLITDFLKDLVFRCVFRVGEELDDLGEFLRFLDNEREVTLIYIYEYVMDELELDIPPNRQHLFMPVEQPVKMQIQEEVRMPASDETGVLDINFWEQNRIIKDADKIQRHSQKLRQTMEPQQQSAMTSQGDETGLLDASFWDRKMQSGSGPSQGAMQMSSRLSLVNVKSREEVQVTRKSFIVGKDVSSCDLVIENKTISRRHAEILTKGSRYYVRDLGSTNKTFVGNTELKAHVEVEIFDGTRIKFSNEMYEVVVR